MFTVDMWILLTLILQNLVTDQTKTPVSDTSSIDFAFRPLSPWFGGHSCVRRLRLRLLIIDSRFLLSFYFRPWGSCLWPLCGRALESRGAAVLVQTHGAKRVDGQANLLSEPHQQPVDLAPQLPATQWHKGISHLLDSCVNPLLYRFPCLSTQD